MKKTRLDARYIIAFGSALILLVGLYLKFLYDVPDSEELTNMWVSWFLIVLGFIGFVVSVIWKPRRNPLEASEYP